MPFLLAVFYGVVMSSSISTKGLQLFGCICLKICDRLEGWLSYTPSLCERWSM